MQPGSSIHMGMNGYHNPQPSAKPDVIQNYAPDPAAAAEEMLTVRMEAPSAPMWHLHACPRPDVSA